MKERNDNLLPIHSEKSMSKVARRTTGFVWKVCAYLLLMTQLMTQLGYLLIFQGFLLIGLLAVGGCGSPDPNSTAKNGAEEKLDPSLTFKDVTLDQVNEEGEKIWTVRSPLAKYRNEKKIVNVELPQGELFQNGKLLYKFSAKKGEVHQNGEKILLQENIVATDPENGAALRGQELEWFPKQNLLIVRQLIGTHPQMEISAQEGKVLTKMNQLELQGNVVATTKEPVLQMRSEALVWLVKQQLVKSDRTLEFDRYLCNSVANCAPSDRSVSDRGEYNLQTLVAKLENNVQLTLSQPPINVQSDLILWSLTAQTVTSEKPLQAFHRQRQFTLTGNQGVLNLPTELLTVTGNVRATGNPQKPFNLQANLMVWDIPKEEMEAEGNVVYQQANPPLTLSGQKAFGKLRNQTVLMTGGNVVTEVVP